MDTTLTVFGKICFVFGVVLALALFFYEQIKVWKLKRNMTRVNSRKER